MSSNQICNIIRSVNLANHVIKGISYEWDSDGWLHVHGTQGSSSAEGVTSVKTPIHLEAGEYVISAEVEGGGLGTYAYVSIWLTDDSRSIGSITQAVSYYRVLSVTEPVDVYVCVNAAAKGETVDYRMRFMLVEGDTPAAWAPAEGETLAGGGALMSANLWKAENVTPAGIPEDGIYACSGTRGVRTDVAIDRLAENQTFHCGFSVNPGANKSALNVALLYKDAAGNTNYAFTANASAPAGKWTRVSADVVVPSGMTVYQMVLCNNGNASGASGWKVMNPTLSLGSPVCLASSAHTPYATQDHLRSEYATKAALKVTSDAVTAEVTERGKLAGRVGTLESTSGTHTSKLEQLATSIKSLVKGESTYTDPDGKSATSGIYSLVTQTRDSVTALFGSYTKTADLASTQAVKDAKKAGTDAQAAASAAQTTANSAKSTADSLATMIREDATGITVGKSADGKTWSTGRTRMTDKAFQVLDKAGAVIAQLAGDGVSLLAGLVRLQARKDGSNTVASISSDFLSLDSLRQAVMRAGDRTGGSYASGYAAAIAEVTGKRGMARLYCTQGDGSHITANNAFTVNPDGYDLSQPEYLAAALLGTGGGGSGATHSQEGVPVTSDLDACGPGVFSYDTSTANRPTDYGTCVCIRAGSGNWLFQLALPTAGDPRWRRNVNGAGWSAWWTITSQ